MATVISSRTSSWGARVVITGRDERPPARATLRRETKADNADDIARVVSTTAERYGRIDGLVNNAATLRRETILTTDFDFLRHVLEVNLMGEVEVWKRNGKHAA